MGAVRVRLYEELNDHLPSSLRKREFSLSLAAGAQVLDALTVLRVPAQQVDLVLLNGESAPLDRPLRPGDRISVFPVFERFDIRPLTRVRHRPLRRTRFLAWGASLDGCVRLLRSLGLDVEQGGPDGRGSRSEEAGSRVVLHPRGAETPRVPRMLCVPPGPAADQARFVVQSLQLEADLRPLGRCPACNHSLAIASTPSLPHEARGRPCPRCGLRPWNRHWARCVFRLYRHLSVAAGEDASGRYSP